MRTAAEHQHWRAKVEAAVRRALARQRAASGLTAAAAARAAQPPQPPQPPQPAPFWDPTTWDDIVDEEVRPVADDAVNHARTSVIAALPAALAVVGGTLGLGDGWSDRIVDAARGLGNRTADRIANAAPGDDLDATILGIFDGADGQAANVGAIATQAGNGIAADGVAAAADQGFSLEKTWNTVGDDAVREDHMLAEGQTVLAAEPFQVGDDLLMFPGDPSGSDEQIIGCRCWLTFEGYGTEGDVPDPGAAMGEADVGGE